MKLHILGPAFGLPSIDPECNAAVALLHNASKKNSLDWEIIPSHDAAISPSGQLPLLVDGETRIAGYSGILKHLQHEHNIDFDSHSSPISSATATALRSFLISTALPLIDLSLYCTYQNYYNLTSPAYTFLLPWHTNYSYPPQRREEARIRTVNLGLSSLDVETLYDNMDAYTQQGASISGQFEATKKAAEQGRSKGPSLLPFGRSRLSGSPEHSDRFKLQQVANRLFEPLDAMLGNKRWLLSEEQRSSADFLAWGYLSLIFYPEFPQSWSKEALMRWPRLVKYTKMMREEFVDGANIDAKAVMAGQQHGSLPWRLSSPSKLLATTGTIGREVLSAIPVPQQLIYFDTTASSDSTAGIMTRLFAFSSLALSILLGVGYHLATQGVPTWDYEFRSSDYADDDEKAPAFARSSNDLNTSDVIAQLQEALHPNLDLDTSQERERERLGGGVVGEVEVDIDVK